MATLYFSIFYTDFLLDFVLDDLCFVGLLLEPFLEDFFFLDNRFRDRLKALIDLDLLLLLDLCFRDLVFDLVLVLDFVLDFVLVLDIVLALVLDTDLDLVLDLRFLDPDLDLDQLLVLVRD